MVHDLVHLLRRKSGATTAIFSIWTYRFIWTTFDWTGFHLERKRSEEKLVEPRREFLNNWCYWKCCVLWHKDCRIKQSIQFLKIKWTLPPAKSCLRSILETMYFKTLRTWSVFLLTFDLFWYVSENIILRLHWISAISLIKYRAFGESN